MDPDTAVTTSVLIALAGLAGCVVLLLFLIARWKWHVFLALLVPILLFGILPGVQRNNFIEAFELGFGKTLGSIGIVIVLGSIIAEALRHTGGVQVITRSMVRLVGAKRMPFALTLSGFILGVAIFSDVAYVILNPLVHSAAHAMGVGIGTMSIGLVGWWAPSSSPTPSCRPLRVPWRRRPWWGRTSERPSSSGPWPAWWGR